MSVLVHFFQLSKRTEEDFPALVKRRGYTKGGSAAFLTNQKSGKRQ